MPASSTSRSNGWRPRRLAFTVEILVGILVSIPFTTTILLGGLSSMPQDTYEAAMVDGASGWHQFRYITLPLMKPFINIAIVLNVIYVFNSLPDHLGDDRGRPRERDRHPRHLPLQAGLPLRAARQGGGDLADHVRRAAALHHCSTSALVSRNEEDAAPESDKDHDAASSRRSMHLLGCSCSPLVVVILFPFAVMFVTAVRPRDELFVYPPTWTFSEFRWEQLRRDVGEDQLRRRAAEQPLCQHHGHAHRAGAVDPGGLRHVALPLRGQGRSTAHFLLMTQMMSPIVLVLGLFRLMMALGLVNDLNSLVITYAAFNIAFTIWMLQSYFNSIPRDLEEAAWMDGASHFTSLVKVFLPLAVPAMVVTAIFTFINSWNEFVLALTMMRSSEQFTLPVQIYRAGRRALSGRMAPRHGGHRAGHRARGDRVLVAPALPHPRHGAWRGEMTTPIIGTDMSSSPSATSRRATGR